MDPSSDSVIFPFDSFDLGQYESEPSAGQLTAKVPNTEAPRAKATNKGKNWSSNKDIWLCKAWGLTSLDPDQGDSQKRTTYWGRIFDNFVEEVREATGLKTIRNASACERRWGTIQHDVTKFCAAYDQATSSHYTGRGHLDVLEIAHQIYAATNEEKRFTLEHSWAILRQFPKWCTNRNQLEKNKKEVSVKKFTKTTTKPSMASSNPPAILVDGAPSSTSQAEGESSEPMEPKRPIGRKSAKESKAADSKKRANNAGADIAAANMRLAEASAAKVKIAAMAAADARQALDDKIMLNPAPQDLDEVQMQYWRDRRQQIADRLRQKNTQDFETVIPNKDRCDETVGEAA